MDEEGSGEMTIDAQLNFIINACSHSLIRLACEPVRARDRRTLAELESAQRFALHATGGIRTPGWIPNVTIDRHDDGSFDVLIAHQDWPEMAKQKGRFQHQPVTLELEPMQRGLFHVEPEEMGSFINQRSRERRA